MVDIVEVLVEELSVSTGTGDFTLTGKSARRTFNEGYGIGGTDKLFYFITHQSADEWEHGTGHLSGAATLVRDTVIKSSNAGALVDFSVGTKDIVSDRPGNLPINVGEIQFAPEIFNAPGDYTPGVTTMLTLAITPISEGNLLIFFEGVIQHTTAYSLVGNVITFTSAIPVGVDQVETRVVKGGGVLTQSQFFDSAITAGGALDLAHTLPSTPIVIIVQLLCVTAQHGYVAGELTYPSVMGISIAGNGTGISIIPGPTNLIGRYGDDINTFNILDATTGAEAQITNANWNTRITAFA